MGQISVVLLQGATIGAENMLLGFAAISA